MTDVGELDDEANVLAEPPVPLAKGFNISELFNGSVMEIDVNMLPDNWMKKKPALFIRENIDTFFLDIMEEGDEEGSPFLKLANKMENVTDDGRIKKLIKTPGKGNSCPEWSSYVAIKYVSYLEYHDEPTDAAYINKQFRFQLGRIGIEGLDIAVSTMKLEEKSLFLIGHEYAFGKLGHPPRIPPESDFLYQIELVDFSEIGAYIENITRLDVVEMPFSDAKKVIVTVLEKAKRHVRRDVKTAIYHYNKGLSILDICIVDNIEDQMERQRLKIRLLTNLAVCYVKDTKPRKTLDMCRRIHDLTKNSILTVSAKVYYQEASALCQMLNFEAALDSLKKAQKMSPSNEEINGKIIEVVEAINKARKTEIKWIAKY